MGKKPTWKFSKKRQEVNLKMLGLYSWVWRTAPADSNRHILAFPAVSPQLGHTCTQKAAGNGTCTFSVFVWKKSIQLQKQNTAKLPSCVPSCKTSSGGFHTQHWGRVLPRELRRCSEGFINLCASPFLPVGLKLHCWASWRSSGNVTVWAESCWCCGTAALLSKFLQCPALGSPSVHPLTQTQPVHGGSLACFYPESWFFPRDYLSPTALCALFSINLCSTPYFHLANSSSHPSFCILQTFKQFIIGLYAIPRYLGSFFSIHEIVSLDFHVWFPSTFQSLTFPYHWMLLLDLTNN